jgi:hypothetical protein
MFLAGRVFEVGKNFQVLNHGKERRLKKSQIISLTLSYFVWNKQSKMESIISHIYWKQRKRRTGLEFGTEK